MRNGATPAISAIIPARNAGATLSAALDSLLAQTWQDWEAIVVDDDSTDDTAGVAQAYAGRDGRIRLITGTGSGVSAARNRGIAAASGSRLLFLDADDWIADSHLASLIAALDAAPDAKAAYCADQRIAANGTPLPVRWVPQVAEAPFPQFARRCPVAIHAVIVERQLVRALGGFDESLQTCEDWDLWQRIARTGARFVGIEPPLAFYRLEPDSLSRKSGRLLQDAMRVIDRGFAADPRVVSPAGAFAAGAPEAADGEAALCKLFFALWCIGRDAAGGGEPSNLLSYLPAIPDLQAELWNAAGMFVAGASIGAGLPPSALAREWPSIEQHLGASFARLDAGSRNPGLATRLSYATEHLVLWANDLAEPVTLQRIVGLRVDLRRLETLELPPGIDLLRVIFCHGAEILAACEIPVFGTVTESELANVAIDIFELKPFIRLAQPWYRPAFWPRLARHGAVPILRAAFRGPKGGRWRMQVRKAVLSSVEHAVRGPHGQAQAGLADVVADAGRGFAPRAVAASAAGGHALTVTQKDYWERFFETDDPWNYTSPYEQEKYERTLSLLPNKAIDRALELACAEGHFTIQLAGRVGSLIAADISERALGRARTRCAGCSNVTFQQNDLSTDALPQGLDLIVCSEVLYFLKDESELRSVARRMAEALAPDGCLLTAHAFLLKDDLDRTGFDWESAAYGAARISQVLQETAGLVLEQSIVTDLYRIDQLRRRPEDTPATPPRIQEMPVEAPIAPEVERHLIRGGARILRADVRRTETTERLPILMYHSVATGGSDRLRRYRLAPERFEAQMRWLRVNGYHAVTSTEVAAHFAGHRPFRGRPVWLTFDDGLRDFHDFAWPILQRCDFTAENFVVTDLVGGTAGWESDAEHDLPLMDWAQISSLSRAGIRFGSHLASHSYADSLSSRALVDEAVRSRLTLEDHLGTDVFALAAPYGTLDERLWRIAGASGYRLCLSTRPGVARLGDSIMDLPRIEITGNCDLAAFAAILESAR